MNAASRFLLMSIFVFAITLALPGIAAAQWVKFIANPYQAKYRVYETRKREEATHWIYRVSRPQDIRKPGDWYVVENPQLFRQSVTLYRVRRKDEADMVVYYVSTSDSARIRQSR